MLKPSIYDFGYMTNSIPLSAIIVGSVKVAFVAVLETLISAKIADNLTDTRFDQSKECFGLGFANILSGFFGGTPCTGVLVRTAVNVASGANNKMSQFLNAVTVLVMTLTILPLFTYIPMPCIASILMVSACRLIPIGVMKELWKVDKAELLILLVTAFICVFMDGALGLMIGGAIALLRNARTTGGTNIVDVNLEDQALVISINGAFTYVNAAQAETTSKSFIKAHRDQCDFVIINLKNT